MSNAWYTRTESTHWKKVQNETCPTCHGAGVVSTGHERGDDYDYHECLDCLGVGSIERCIEVLPEDDYRAVTRQERYLNQRYGRIPAHIADYWKG